MSTIAKWASTGTSIGTITSLTTNTAGPDVETDDGIYQPFILVPSAAGIADVFRVEFYETVDATQAKIWEGTFRGRGADFIWVGPALHLGVGWDITVVKVSGTDRTLKWHVNELA